jgi:uncharacterized protein (TIGR00251 family)
MIKETNEGIVISLKISPNSKKNEIISNENEIKVKITAQPIDGKANKCLIEFLSKNFKIPKTSIVILKGETSKEKTILFKTQDMDKLIKLKETFSK